MKTNKGMIIDDETLNRYEIENRRLSYRTAWNRITGNAPLILCNNIASIDDSILYNVVIGSLYDEETDEYTDIYQYFLTDLNDWDIEALKEYGNDNFIVTYSELLDTYVLCVDHFGTAWDYVLTDIELS